jgi:hypothetical protein
MKPQRFALIREFRYGRQVDFLDREAVGRLLREYMRQGSWPRVEGDGPHTYSVAVPAGRYSSAYVLTVMPESVYDCLALEAA